MFGQIRSRQPLLLKFPKVSVEVKDVRDLGVLTGTVLRNDCVNELGFDGVHDEIGCSGHLVSIT